MHCLSAPEDGACSRNLPLFVDAQTQERQGSGVWNGGYKRVLIRDFSIESNKVLYSCLIIKDLCIYLLAVI